MYNDELLKFKWFSYEASDKPQAVPLGRKVKKLKGKAVSHWTHIRNLPLLLKKFVLDRNDSIFCLGLKLHELTERMTAVEFVEYEIQLLEECIEDYLDLRKNLCEEMPDIFERAKPKHHFIR